MDIKFRLATSYDVPALQELIALSARGLSIGYYSAEQIESAVSHAFGVDSQLISDGTYFIVEDGERAVACGGWSKRRTLYGGDQLKKDWPDALLNPAREAARIRAFFVHPDCGRRGIGRRLLEVCVEAAKRAGFTSFELGATSPGVPFYKALGFETYDEVKLDLPDGVQLPITCMRYGATL